MKIDFQIRLKKYLINNLIREGEREAWDLLKTKDLTTQELAQLVEQSPFADEAWEMLLAQNPSVEEMLKILNQSGKREEAKAYIMAKLPLDNAILEEIVIEMEDDQAAEILLAQNPTHDQLVSIMEYSSLKDQAARMLLDDAPENDTLIEIIDYSSLKQEAWDKLLLQSPTNEELIRCVQYTDWVEPAWAYFIQQNPTNEELMDFVQDYGKSGKKRKEAAEILLQRDLSIQECVEMISSDQLADEVWERLVQMNPPAEDLFYVIWRETVKRNEAAAYCLAQNPSEDLLWEIISCTDLKAEAALQLIQFPQELHKLADIALYATAEPVLNLLAEKVNFDRSQVNEELLVREIAQKLLANPELLNVKHWHDGDTHCFGGWGITLHAGAQAVEKEYGSEIAASLILPSYSHLFFANRETVMRELENIIEA